MRPDGSVPLPIRPGNGRLTHRGGGILIRFQNVLNLGSRRAGRSRTLLAIQEAQAWFGKVLRRPHFRV